jgi:beta-glucosidase-like glycosyl hydrolase
MRYFLVVFLCFSAGISLGQQNNSSAAKKWTDSVYNTLSNDERIGQLIVARLSTIDMKTKKITFLNDSVAAYVKRYNIGGVCLFQGSPQLQAGMVNNLKRIAKTPILFSIDGEWGVGMRIFDSVLPLPRQMMLGAMSDSSIVYQYGKVVADQCKRLGIQMNYAPDVDVNNNPNNPVINDRSFGEDKHKVASFGIQYMKGMQDNGVMACAKHFPGHGDVAVDSHLDLPVINKSMGQLDSTEL